MKGERQPIETAPKDGAQVLGWSFIFGVEVVKFMDGDFDDETKWRDSGGLLAWPTHWMPLPERPEVKS